MSRFSHWLVVQSFTAITGAICRVHQEELAKVPAGGPLILVMNHVNMLELPLLYTRLQPRPITGLVASERWDNRFLRWLLETTGSIPVHRGEGDVAMMRRGLAALEAKRILMLAPEGTRSHHGRLQKAHPGAAMLALHSGAPVMPVMFWGAEHYTENLRRLKRSDFYIRVGRPFHLDLGEQRATKEVRQRLADEIMYEMAALLPPQYRGDYANLSAATQQYLVFDPAGAAV